MLKPGGLAMHWVPSKWYLPREPHIFVPLANVFWTRVPWWWLAPWARLGVRNSYQLEDDWRTVADRNAEYCRTGLSYWSHARYRRLALRVFGNFETPMRFFVDHAYGRFARLLRRLPARGWTGRLSSWFRMTFIVTRKTA